MEVVQVLHMNKGEGETSYAKNSVVQKKIISIETSIIKEAVQKCLEKNFPDSMGIADLGCSTGPNSLMVISDVIDTIYATSNQKEIPLPEIRISLNDLPGNDFNSIFISLPEFYNQLKKEKNIGQEGCFISGVAGSFYGRLFPKKSLHFVHSSSSLHWLSQVPRVLDSNILKPLNKGKIYISKSSPRSVLDAYLSQFKRDFTLFLKSRSEEMVVDGHMVLSFIGRVSADPASGESCMQWELLAQALMSMALEGIIEEEKIDSFNAPSYAPSAQEVRSVVEEEGSFTINCLEAIEIEWDGGQQAVKTIRAVAESMLEVHFGKEIMDELFKRYAELVGDYISKTRAKFFYLVISLTKKG
ncbi:jasmonate O-methyltransferase-like [Olea europaea subsp. europaea]|uniref:Jasmonate O-methyltransferase-like n=1 Tax=Olea europaea subsp. europaea TaxID=158383 RepID=A0A8S0V786_OLEEU|nr:jasmonate O-methyltransferase-like [Olea europaea subsp. europaea]